MAYRIERKLVIGVASSALFDLSEADEIFRKGGEEVYREYQRKNQNKNLEKGVAFPFIRRFLSLNTIFPDKKNRLKLSSSRRMTLTLGCVYLMQSANMD